MVQKKGLGTTGLRYIGNNSKHISVTVSLIRNVLNKVGLIGITVVLFSISLSSCHGNSGEDVDYVVKK